MAQHLRRPLSKEAFMLTHRCLPWSAAVMLALASTLVTATSQRTFVASIGTDNPACSITAPCRSFAAAITATSSNGEIIVLDSAGYGKVTITKSVSIIGAAWHLRVDQRHER
jgi:hypothetical protein